MALFRRGVPRSSELHGVFERHPSRRSVDPSGGSAAGRGVGMGDRADWAAGSAEVNGRPTALWACHGNRCLAISCLDAPPFGRGVKC